MEINVNNLIEKMFTYQEDHSYNQAAEKIPQTYSSHKFCASSRNSYNNSIANALQGKFHPPHCPCVGSVPF
jgi:hypothetical protein